MAFEQAQAGAPVLRAAGTDRPLGADLGVEEGGSGWVKLLREKAMPVDSIMMSTESRSSAVLSRWLVLVLAAVFFTGCHGKQTPRKNGSVQVDGDTVELEEKPTAQKLLSVTAPDFKPRPNAKSECLGRLVFEIEQDVEWPTYFYVDYPAMIFNRSFSSRVFAGGDIMRFGKVQIAVISTTGGVKKEMVFHSTSSELIARLENSIQKTRAYVAELKEKRAPIAQINEGERWIREEEEIIREERQKFSPFDPGLPDSRGYGELELDRNEQTKGYSKLRAYLTRGEYIYVFESTERMEVPGDVDVHKQKFQHLLSKFRTRSAHEIPTEPGVCIPFGFIPDDGRTTVEFKQSLRYPDAPGVLYTIETGTVHPRRLKATRFKALVHATVAAPPADDDETRAVVTERVGVQPVKIGGVDGWQGGVVMRTKLGGESHEVYSVYSGYSGWLGTIVLPYMIVEMHSISRTRAPELMQHPPPFKQSMNRLDVILKSMRWRPTDPTMSEFQQQ